MLKELDVLAKEKYDATGDLREAFDRSRKEDLRRQILRTIPEHVFWDVKKPNLRENFVKFN